MAFLLQSKYAIRALWPIAVVTTANVPDDLSSDIRAEHKRQVALPENVL